MCGWEADKRSCGQNTKNTKNTRNAKNTKNTKYICTIVWRWRWETRDLVVINTNIQKIQNTKIQKYKNHLHDCVEV